MLPYDPIPWLTAQDGLPALRARRMLGLRRDGDERAVRGVERRFARSQRANGSFEDSPMKTAGVLNLLDDLRGTGSAQLIERAAAFLPSVLRSQPGYERAGTIRPGRLREPFDLCRFFGPYEDRDLPEAMARGAREMNFYRELEPLLGPKSPVRATRRSSLDRPGPGSCYAWGLIPLAYTIEALCRAGHPHDEPVRTAINALLGAHRESGGWCRNLGGHPSCTIHAIRALGAHPRLGKCKRAARALEFMRSKGAVTYALMQAAATFDLAVADDIIRDGLAAVAPRQRKNGTFGGPCQVERVAAVLVAVAALEGPARGQGPTGGPRT